MQFRKPFGLKKRAAFLRVQGTGQRFRGKLIVMQIASMPGSPGAVGFTVSRRVGKAVTRNRVRRRLREVVRLHQQMLSRGYEVVLIALPGAAMAPFAALQEEVTCLLARAQRWAAQRLASSS